MAIELCSDSSSMGMSPRISFSHDLSQSDGVPIEQYIRSTSSSSSLDFDFCVFRGSFDQESSSADELFSDGKILPIEIKRKLGSSSNPPKNSSFSSTSEPPSTLQLQSTGTSSLHDHHDSDDDTIKNTKNDQSPGENRRGCSDSDEKQTGKSFWRFKRSYSLNCGSGYARSLCPLPLLSRSNSTGSTPNVKRSSSGKDANFSNKQHSGKSPLFSPTKLPQPSASSAAVNHQKPPLKKSLGSYGNGVKVTPVLNVPSASMFGLGSIFSPGKDKVKKK